MFMPLSNLHYYSCYTLTKQLFHYSFNSTATLVKTGIKNQIDSWGGAVKASKQKSEALAWICCFDWWHADQIGAVQVKQLKWLEFLVAVPNEPCVVSNLLNRNFKETWKLAHN